MKRVFVVFVVGLLCAPALFADAPQTGVVTGTVLDPDGMPMPGVTIQLISERGTMTTVAKADGSFLFAFLVPGEYTVRADLQGFNPAAGQIMVSAGGRSDVELKLSEEMGEEILVTGEAPLVNRFDMTGGGTVDRRELEAITGASNEYKSRLMFMPDVVNDPESDSSYGRQPSIAGTAGSRSLYFIDGFDVSFARWGGGSQLELPVAAVAEIKLESSGADAEYSRAIGGITKTIIKSGTNQLHGSASWKGENLAWNAENKVVETERPDKTFHSYDMTLGGPILKDKLWFFVTARHEEQAAYSVMADEVSVVQDGSQGDSWLAKIDWRPSSAHSFALLATETPYEFPWWASNTYGDLETVAWFEWGGDILSARWNWAIDDSLLLTLNAGTTDAEQIRTAYVESNIEAGCGPEDPCGNNWVYRPLGPNARWPQTTLALLNVNGVGLPFGEGYTNFPRDQYNASLEWFTGVHDIKLGIDHHDTAWDLGGVSVPFCRGRAYDETAPGGFLSNGDTVASQLGWCRFFPTKETWQDGYGPIDFGATNTAFFLKDRIALDRWTFNVGVRVDQQEHSNDIGDTTIDSSDVAPRVAASYDVFGDSKLILDASGGRYYAQVDLSWSNAFNAMPSGRTQYEEYRWDPATGGYDTLTRVVAGLDTLDIVQVDPYYKDEYQIGAEWQFHRDWALKFRATWWESESYPVILDQMDLETGLYQEVGISEARTEREAYTIAVQRRFRSGWMVAANYTYSKLMDSCGYGDNGQCASNYGALRVWTEDGVPVSQINAWGRGLQDRPHVAKVRGAYQARLGKGHSINIGGLAYMHSGRAWAPGETRTIPAELDPLGQSPTLFVNLAPYGAERLDDRFQLDLNVEWRFPIAGDFSGYLRADILNATDEQELLAISGLPQTGTPTISSENFQYPRTVRLLAGIQF